MSRFLGNFNLNIFSIFRSSSILQCNISVFICSWTLDVTESNNHNYQLHYPRQTTFHVYEVTAISTLTFATIVRVNVKMPHKNRCDNVTESRNLASRGGGKRGEEEGQPVFRSGELAERTSAVTTNCRDDDITISWNASQRQNRV